MVQEFRKLPKGNENIIDDKAMKSSENQTSRLTSFSRKLLRKALTSDSYETTTGKIELSSEDGFDVWKNTSNSYDTLSHVRETDFLGFGVQQIHISSTTQRSTGNISPLSPSSKRGQLDSNSARPRAASGGTKNTRTGHRILRESVATGHRNRASTSTSDLGDNAEPVLGKSSGTHLNNRLRSHSRELIGRIRSRSGSVHHNHARLLAKAHSFATRSSFSPTSRVSSQSRSVFPPEYASTKRTKSFRLNKTHSFRSEPVEQVPRPVLQRLYDSWKNPVQSSSPKIPAIPDLTDEAACDEANISSFPTQVWHSIESQQRCQSLPNVTTPKSPDMIRFVCISDTHGKHYKMGPIPDGDVLLCAGDITMVGEVESLFSFSSWLRRQPHEHKIVIGGNHDVTLEEGGFYPANYKRFAKKMENAQKAREIMKSATHFTYLEDESIQVEGYSVYGTPWQPTFMNWGFNRERGAPCREKWKAIPTSTDIVLVHGPPLGYGDSLQNGEHVGCVDLLRELQLRVVPQVVVFGHVHESYGVYTDGATKYVNASTCDHSYAPINPPIVFDLPRRVVALD